MVLKDDQTPCIFKLLLKVGKSSSKEVREKAGEDGMQLCLHNVGWRFVKEKITHLSCRGGLGYWEKSPFPPGSIQTEFGHRRLIALIASIQPLAVPWGSFQSSAPGIAPPAKATLGG